METDNPPAPETGSGSGPSHPHGSPSSRSNEGGGPTRRHFHKRARTEAEAESSAPGADRRTDGSVPMEGHRVKPEMGPPPSESQGRPGGESTNASRPSTAEERQLAEVERLRAEIDRLKLDATANQGGHSTDLPPRGLKARLNPPPPYKGERDGGKAEAFLRAMARYHALMSVSDETTRVQSAAYQLADQAEVWWSTLEAQAASGGKPLPNTWRAFEQALKSKFTPVSRKTTAINRLSSISQKGSLAEYIADLQRLAMDMPGVDEDILQVHFIRGLRVRNIQLALEQRPDLDLDGMYALAERMDACWALCNESSGSGSGRASFGAGKGKAKTAAQSNAVEVSPKKKKGKSSGKDTICFKCGQKGHIRRNCPNGSVPESEN